MKRVFAVAIVFCMSINSFAAIVADNDGSAFITKAEFDSLKNSFQSQIDNYNSSIDSKIDGAIAAYLAGISTATMSTEKNYPKYDDIVFMNGVVKNSYALETLRYIIGYQSYKVAETSTAKLNKWANFILSGAYTQPSTTKLKRSTCKIIGGTEATPTKIQWTGRALDWRQTSYFSMSKSALFDDYWSSSEPNQSMSFTVNNIWKWTTNSVLSNGNPGTAWQPSLAFKNNTQGRSNNEKTVNKEDYLVSSTIAINKVNNKETDYDHIIGYKKDTKWYISCKDAVNTYRNCPETDVTEETVHSNIEKTDFAKNANLFTQGNATTKVLTRWEYTDYAMTLQYNNGTTKRSVCGMLLDDWTNGTINQYEKDDQEITSTKRKLTVGNPTLSEGWQLGYANEDDNIEWVCNPSEVKTLNSSGGTRTNLDEVDVYVSYVPFTDTVTSSDLIKFTQNNVEKNYFTTTNRKGILKWKMNKTSLFYVKCVPHIDNTLLEKDWEIKFDLKNGSSGSYKRMVEK